MASRNPAARPGRRAADKTRKENPRPASRVRLRDANGRSVSLASLPLVAYATTCGHLGRDYAISKGDQVFCEQCGTTRRVNRIIAQ